MAEQVLFDNDIALKVACYSLTDETQAIVTDGETKLGMLGVGRFVLRDRLERPRNVADLPRARASLDRLLETVEFIEPNEDELALAAEFETEARVRDLELDSGESQLLAIVIRRNLHVLVTGDKRAITAMAVVAAKLAAGRVVCLEQLMMLIVKASGLDAVRPRVCGEPHVDRAITACFGCARSAVPPEDVAEGLTSYIGYLDRSAPGILTHEFGHRRAN